MFKSAATKIAHNSTLPSLGGNKDLKPLQDLITAEKTVLISLQKLSVDFAKASEALRTWGLGEGDDLGDTLSASTAMLTYFSSALTQFATHEHSIRDHLKTMRSREEALDELKRRRKSVAAKAESAEKKLSKMSPEHKNLFAQTDILNKLHEDIRSMDSEIMNEEAALGDFKRATTQTLMSLKFGGLLECCEKGTIAGEYGLLIIAEIPQETTQPGLPRSMFHGHPKVESLVTEAHRCISEVTFSPVLSSEHSRLNRKPMDTSDPNFGGDLRTSGGPPPPGADGWPQDSNIHNSVSMIPSGEGPPYLPPPQDMGGHFLEASETSSIGPGSPYQPSPHQPTPFYPQQQSNEVPRSVDDFGVNTPSGPINSAAGGGGRFATFPVKNRNAGITGPPSLNNRHKPGPSLSSSIEEALGSPNPVPSGPPGGSFDNPMPPQYMGHPSMHAPPAPLGAAGPANPWTEEGHGDGRNAQISEEDTQLAYMTDPMDHENQYDHGSKHVRFGEVHDVEDFGPRIPAHNGPPPQNRESRPDAGPVGSGSLLARGDGNFIDPQEEERMLNAAAAREVSRELDSLTFNPPSPINLNHPSSPDQPDRGRSSSLSVGFGQNPPSTHSDAPPPVAPFTRPSPRPSLDTSSVPYTGSLQDTPNQGYSEPQTSSPYTQTQNPPPYGQPPGRLSPSKDQDPRSISPMANNPPYRGPSEYGLGSSPPPLPSNKPSSANASPVPSGMRTISAAAFKRPPPRVSGDGLSSDTTPLSVKKRLPSSPYPQGGPAPSALSREILPNRSPSGRERVDSNSNPPPAGDDESFDYISAYVNNPPGGSASPREMDYGSLGNIKVTNGDGGGSSHGYGEGRFATDLEGSLR